MRLLVSVGVTLLAAAVLFGVGWRAGADRERAAHKAREELIRDAAAAFDAKAAERIAAIKVTRTTINGQVREVVRENPVYRDCVLDEPLQRLLEAAREGRATPGPAAAGGLLPGPGAGAAP